MKLAELLAQSVKQGASDLHLSSGQPPMLRIDGNLAVMKDMPALDSNATQELVYSVMEKEQQAFFEKERELDFAVSLPAIAGFRVNVFHQAHGIAAVFRVIPDQVPTLDQLDFPAVFKRLLALPNGLILVTGPTGSGKSTTLAAMVEYINTNQACHIITIEDPT